MVDLRLLQALRVLHARGTVTATAQALNLSPSAVSQQLRQLSHAVGATLLVRDGRRLRLTPAGQVLLRHADDLLAQWERVRADLAEEAGDQHTTLHIGGFATCFGALLAPAASALQQTTPLRVRISETDSDACYQQLLSGRIDIAVLTPLPDSPPVDDPRFDQQPLLDDQQDLVVPLGHPLAGSEVVDLPQVAAETWIAPHHDQRRLIESLCGAAGFAPRMDHHAGDWASVLALIAHGLGVCLVPRLVPLTAHPGVTRVPVRGDPQPCRRVLTCVRSGSRQQPAIARALAALQEQAVIARRLDPARP
ncbi:LysR family transcriptional regulator [Streptomyces sp. NPDC057702]|uniref:LysR family transcriptional regulator n=1 Tax=unclassified Streptomyces TaxID=2593676 RepID=UPI0036A33F9F